MLDLDLIRIDGGTQIRAELNQDTVDSYAEAYLAGAVFPPVTVFYDGKDRWLADGFHRYFAVKKAGKTTIHENITPGTKRDAILFSLGANGTHGLNRTNADKRNAIATMLQDTEWAAWSDNAIAKACHVSHPFVATVRKSLETVSSEKPAKRTYTTKHGTTATMQTKGIGKTKAKAEPPEPQDSAEPVPTVQIEDADYSGPSAAEIQAVQDSAKNDLDTVMALLESDDPKASLVQENERQRMEIAALKSQRDGYMNQANELIRRVKSLRKMLDKAQGK